MSQHYSDPKRANDPHALYTVTEIRRYPDTPEGQERRRRDFRAGTDVWQNYPDPRGFAGPRHSATALEEYPGALFCWDCVNEHGSEGWNSCKAIAKAQTEALAGAQA